MSEPKHVAIQHWKRGDLNLRLVINRSHGHARIMDYRVGNYEEKRNELDELALQEGLRKVFTLVEKQDSHNWRSVGFFKEGVYPSFFRTADAYAMSRLYDEAGYPAQNAGPVKPQPSEQTSFPERRIRKPGGLKLDLVKDERSRNRVMSGLDGELRALPFGREDAPDLVLHAWTRNQEAWVLAEIDDSFGHATLGIAPPPSGEAGLVISACACNDLFGALTQKNVSNLFGLSPVEDRWSNELFAGLGFKVTGRLADHLRSNGGSFTTALVWHRRLS